MGIFVNPSNRLLLRDMNSSVYVDKALLIFEINRLLDTNENFVCVSRPRRFGKSMAGNMLAAFYSKGCDSEEIFSKLKISKTQNWKDNLNKFTVIQMDINGFLNSVKKRENLIEEMNFTVIAELREEFPSVKIDDNESISSALLKIYNQTVETFILLFDEYDILVREQVPSFLFEKYLAFLSSLFKNNNLKPAISLAYLAGILPIVRDRIQSKMNEFDEYSMTNARNFAPFAGFTEEEVRSLCKEHGLDFSECKRWYDGYKLEKNLHIYSPKSVVTAIKDHEFDDYWTQTGSYKALKNYILMNFEGIKDDVVTMIGGGKIDVNIHSYLNTMLTYNNEASFQSAIGLAYFYATAKYTIIKELPTGKGFADVAFIPFIPNILAIIVELKNNKTALGAIEQIKERCYDDVLEHYRGNLLFVGINYDEKTKLHECKIEKLKV